MSPVVYASCTLVTVELNDKDHPGMVLFDHFNGRTCLGFDALKWLTEAGFKYKIWLAFIRQSDQSNSIKIDFEDDIEAKLFCMHFNV